ncbi:CoA transferase [Sphingomonas sp. HDW15A]|uniref:CaiB/BaiF CoA transferase family protein n=1 Tax=Sphingomonas sp. HDW15A TaxID=2714942 RepID=UPI00140CCAB8|nr:CaiB/BaiF CoA-transferase family protein [Sphingomonas sp. HDW15A]QIK95687.1 CoA transferase [Sphingomonas sp. HDW15A]
MDNKSSQGPLNGIRVVEFAGIGPLPHCGMMLADLGAEIVSIQRPGGRLQPPNAALDRGRHRLTLDLADLADAELARDASQKADVVMEGFRPGVMERLGLGPDELCGRNARLIYARLTGWGQDGPLSKTAGHDINYLAVTGALAALGRPGEPPPPPLNLVGDYGGGSMFCLVGILAALVERERSGKGQVVDAAIVDGVVSMLAMFNAQGEPRVIATERNANLLGGAAPFYRCYGCADGRFIAVGALEEKFWAALLAPLGISAAAFGPRFDPAFWPAQARQLESIFATRTAADWGKVYAGTDACVTVVAIMDEAAATPHLAERSSLVDEDGTQQPSPAPRLSRTPGMIRHSSDDGRSVIERWIAD